MKRDCSIDAYRVCLMFGICLLHSITQAGHNVAWAANMLSWCVPGFMFISGWFGIKFSIAKVLKLYGISFYCAIMYASFDMVVSGEGGVIEKVFNIAISQWFLNAYVVVMCIAPIVNLAVDRMTVKDMCPLLLCAFGWSFATTLPVVGRYIPAPSGLTAYSFLTLLGVYVVARFVRRLHESDVRFREFAANGKMLLPIIGICLVLAAVGFGDYNSPFALMLAGGVLLLVNDCRISDRIGKACAWLAPSMFSVYLMHSHGHGWGCLRMIQDGLIDKGVPTGIAYLLTALTVFSVCTVADLPRRLVAIHFNKPR